MDSAQNLTQEPNSPAQNSKERAKKIGRAGANLMAKVVEAARDRVPNVEAPDHLPRAGARLHLKAARKAYSQKNRFFNRATRRALSREVKLT